MQYILLATSLVSVAILIIVIIRLSKSGSDAKTLNAIEEGLRRMEQSITVTNTRLDELLKAYDRFNGMIDSRLMQFSTGNERLTKTVEEKLDQIRSDNERRLEQMRKTVEEKLQSTLETRLSTSFKQVGDQLESVYKQLGEMQNLAQGVGNLEKVLTNVKTRGMWGELQAERILQEILLPEQYLKNVVTKRTGRDPVEFAVRLPGATEGEHVLLPIDSKFPREDYEKLCSATESGDVEAVKILRKALERRILDEAKDIRDKYIDVPYTTDFAILFLPIEGLYAEILSIAGLQDRIQREFHVMIAGPATLASLLNSLQMGFRTLAIEKKSSEVWHVLGEVKTEYGKFGTVLEVVKKKLASASSEIDNAFTRHRAIGRKLRNVEAVESDMPDLLPQAEEQTDSNE
ncbi:MAG: DNA recombination protein RmuC [Spirochaetales bacterium]|nr:DNA recombination protein RmuC [Spirochaetales bacterium]MBO6048816.1 DNA recombination protein RmuC [Spirochaetales bacterium]MBO7349012.1 DNA recombination protein RmuC [Spirochaetales bacterium]